MREVIKLLPAPMIETTEGFKEVPDGIDVSGLVEGDELYEFSPEQDEDGSVLLPVEYEDGTTESVRYVPQSMMEEREQQLIAKIRSVEGVVESLRRELRFKVDPDDFTTPCSFCGEIPEPSEAVYKINCCNRVSHVKCCMKTVLRNVSRFPEDKCPHCMIEESKQNTERMRAQLLGEYNSKPERDDPPGNRAMLMLCQACGFLQNMTAHLSTIWKWTVQDADKVYGVYSSLTKQDLIDHNLTICKLRHMGINLDHLVRDFSVKAVDLFSYDDCQKLSITAEDIGHAQEHAGALIAAGVDSSYLKYRGLSLQSLINMKLSAEAMCILGFTAIDLLTMGLQKDRIRRFEKMTLEEWIILLGLDRRCVFLLRLREQDFKSGGDLENWNMSSLASTLRLKKDDMRALIERDRSRPSLESGPSDRHYGLQVKSAKNNSATTPIRKSLKQ